MQTLQEREYFEKMREERNFVFRNIVKPIIWKLQDGRCPHCVNPLEPIFFVEGNPGKRYPTLEHVIPRSKKGKSTLDNLILSHNRCNRRKANNAPSAIEIEMSRKVVEYFKNNPTLWPVFPFLIPNKWWNK